MHTIFLCFDHNDDAQVHGLRGVLANPNHQLTGRDGSLRMPVRNRQGDAIGLPPTHPSAEAVRTEIRAHLRDASRLVVLVGRDTHSSPWCNWEIEEFARIKYGAGGIYATELPGPKRGAPPALARVGVVTVHAWDPKALAHWLAY